MKQLLNSLKSVDAEAAASARLCVETKTTAEQNLVDLAAASARLCVETKSPRFCLNGLSAAASARLCVETKASKLK